MANRGSLSLPLPPPPPCSPAEKIEKKANSRENEKNIGNVRISPLRSRRRSNSTFQLKKKIPERILEFSANAKPPPPPPRLTERGKKMYGGREKKRKGKVDFDTVLDNLALRELFYAHLKLEKSEENLHFYDAVKRLELKYGDITQDVSTGMVAARTLRKAQKEAKRIYQRFLQENSAEAVNISFRVRKRIHKYFRAMMMVSSSDLTPMLPIASPTAGSNGNGFVSVTSRVAVKLRRKSGCGKVRNPPKNSRKFSDKLHGCITIFEEAVKEVFLLMKTDTFPRFYRKNKETVSSLLEGVDAEVLSRENVPEISQTLQEESKNRSSRLPLKAI
ncbi:hypothetical protein AAMO2058_000759400 [Amorphochlora amoebiformis]